jgi:hypothetical protein
MADTRSTRRYHLLDARLAISGQFPVRATALAHRPAVNVDSAVIV